MPALFAIGADGHARPRRVLYLTHHYPWPASSGGRLREAELLARLIHHASIDLVAVSRRPEIERAEASRRRHPRLQARVFADEAPAGDAPARDSLAARCHLARYLRHTSPDVIHVEGHYLLDLLPTDVFGRTVLVEHNVESELLRQRAATGVMSPRLAWTLAEVHRRERRAWALVARVAAITPEDCLRIRRAVPAALVRHSPNGSDHLLPGRAPASSRAGAAPRLLFVANFAYPPNQDAVTWMIRDVLPHVVAAVPAARLALVGPDLAGEPLRVARGCAAVDVLGWVPRIEEQLDLADVVVCPLRIGGGVKVKVLEAASRGCAVVATPIAIEGLPAALRAAIPVAANAVSFAGHAVRLLGDPALRARAQARIGRAAGCLPSWAEAAERLLAIWDEVASRGSEQP